MRMWEGLGVSNHYGIRDSFFRVECLGQGLLSWLLKVERSMLRPTAYDWLWRPPCVNVLPPHVVMFELSHLDP